MILNTPRLALRPLVSDDFEPLHVCFGDAEAMRYWDFTPSCDVRQTKERLGQILAVDPKWMASWTVVVKETAAIAGWLCYHHREAWHRRLEIGYILAPLYWRRGLMSEAVRTLVAYCIKDLDTHRVEAMIEPENVASIRLAERLGFRWEGVLRDRLLVDGSYRTVAMYALLANELRES